MPCAPVSSTQRTLSSRSSATTAAAIPSRIAWSSALRLAGSEIVRRRTPSAGRSMRTSPLMGREGSRRYSRTTSVSPSLTAWPSSQRISLTAPASSASTGISIFIDSRMTTVSPSSICSPTWHSIFQTVPVMWATTSGTTSSSWGARGAYPGSWTAPQRAASRALRPWCGGYAGAVSDEPAEPLRRQESPEDLTPIRAQVYRDPRPAEIFDRFHARARTRRPDLAYEVVRMVTSLYAWAVFRARGIAPELVPASGPVILAPNHSSFMDHFFLGAFNRRKVSFMAKSQLFKAPMQFIYSHGGVFPVRRGFRDEEAFVTAAAILERGGCIAMYCEGGRSRSGRIGDRARPGIGRLALESGATVVPVAIHGSERVRNWKRLKFPKVTVLYGEPFRYERVEEATRDQQQAVADDILGAIKGLYERLNAEGREAAVARWRAERRAKRTLPAS